VCGILEVISQPVSRMQTRSHGPEDNAIRIGGTIEKIILRNIRKCMSRSRAIPAGALTLAWGGVLMAERGRKPNTRAAQRRGAAHVA
jgi:hypothetical protein